MKRHIVSLAVAAFIMAIATVFPALWHDRSGALGIVAWVTMWPIYPAFFIMQITGPRRGPDGIPDLVDVYILAFVLWWLAIDFGPRLFRGLDGEGEQT